MEEEFDSNQVDHQRSTESKSRRFMNSIKIDSILKIAKDATVVLFGTIKVKGIIKTPNHYKHVNVVVDDLPENQCCKDIIIAQQIQV